MNVKIIAVVVIAGFGCLAFGLLGAPLINHAVVSDSKHAAVVDQSGTNMSLVTLIPFHLERNRELTMTLQVYLNETATSDDTFRLKVISWKTWNESQLRDPSTVIGVSYNTDELAYPPTATPSWTGGANQTFTLGTIYTVVFKGDTPSLSKPLPGDYYIVIYSDDATPDATTLYYDLQVKMDGLAPTLTLWFCIIGAALLAFGVVLGVISRKR